MNQDGLTDENPTPTRTPKLRSSHQSNAPTSPAAPVPDAKYLDSSGMFRQRIAMVLLEERLPDAASRKGRNVGGG